MVACAKLTELQRAEIGALAFEHPNISALARKYHCTRNTIKRWLIEGREPRPNYKNRPGQGRPRKLTPNQEAKFRQKLRPDRSLSNVISRLRPRNGQTISKSTAVRVSHRGRIDFRYLPITRGKCLSSDNIEARLRFCRDNHDLDPRKCVFLDAKYLYLYRDGRANVRFGWQRLDRPRVKLPQSQPIVFLFYGAVAYGRKSTLIFEPPTPPEGTSKLRHDSNFTSEHFVHAMTELKPQFDKWFPDGDYYILRDHAKQHVSKYSSQHMQAMQLPIKSDYPAKSWDLNMIEVVWGILDGKLQGKKATCSDEWRKHIEEAWNQIDQASINKLVLKLPARMHELVENNGQWPKHGA